MKVQGCYRSETQPVGGELTRTRGEARNKRRIGLGVSGLGDALVMLNLRYDTAEARAAARRMAEVLRDAAYDASVELALERGAFPLFHADLLLSRGSFASRLPAALKERVRASGLRNSHLLSIAPTGTISLAFADNAATASSRRSRGATRARSAWPTAPSRNTRSRITPGACSATSRAPTRRCRRPS